jgi:hypothetical protein
LAIKHILRANDFNTLQGAWDEYRQRVVNEKLDQLGIEQGFASSGNHGSSDVPHIHAPHARAASVRI